METCTIGQEVGIHSDSRHGINSGSFGVITKINGHGHITVKAPNFAEDRVFDKHGVARSQYSSLRLISADRLRECIAEHVVRQDARSAVDELAEAVKTLSHYGNVFVSQERKDALLVLVNNLVVNYTPSA